MRKHDYPWLDMENPSQAAVFAKCAVRRVLRALAPVFPLSHPSNRIEKQEGRR